MIALPDYDPTPFIAVQREPALRGVEAFLNKLFAERASPHDPWAGYFSAQAAIDFMGKASYAEGIAPAHVILLEACPVNDFALVDPVMGGIAVTFWRDVLDFGGVDMVSPSGNALMAYIGGGVVPLALVL